MTPIRLDRFVSERTNYTRSQIRQLIRSGRITVDISTAPAPEMKIDPGRTIVSVDGVALSAEKYEYILLNKPAGYICSTDDGDGKTVMDLIPPQMRRKDMFSAGRLDKDSLGEVLITNDGVLAHRMLSPASHIPKIYIVKLDRPFQVEYINKFKNGIILQDGTRCLPARVKQAENSDILAFVELFEGKYHQIKRMFAAVDNYVESLMRISLGGLVLPIELGISQCMRLLHKNVENLFEPLDFDNFLGQFSSVFSAFFINKHL